MYLMQGASVTIQVPLLQPQLPSYERMPGGCNHLVLAMRRCLLEVPIEVMRVKSDGLDSAEAELEV
jgi:hypothetical protein